MNKFIGVHKFFAFVLVGVIFLTSSLVSLSQQKLMGELTITGGGNSGEASFVLVNGERAISGRSIPSPAEIAVPPQTSAKINIGKTGRVEFGANSRMNLTFDENKISGVFTEGLLTVAVAPNTTLNIQTVDGVVTAPEQSQENVAIVYFENGKTRIKPVAGVFSFNGALIHVGEIGGVGGTVAASSGGSIFGVSTITFAVIAGAIAGTVITAVTIANSGDGEVVSPTR